MFAYFPLDVYALKVCKHLVDWPEVVTAMKQPYDLVVIEYFNSDCMHGLIYIYGVKAPVIALSSTGFMPWIPERIGVAENPSYVPLINSDFTTKMGFWQRLENTILQTVHKYWYRTVIQLKEQEIIEKHFGRKIPDLRELAKNVSLIILNTHHSLHGARPLLPGVVEAGGLHMNLTRRPIPEFMERFINESEQGVVLLAFGTVIHPSLFDKDAKINFISACAKLKQRVIWKYENSGVEGTLTGNILRVRWLPQLELLQHPKVLAFVSHGGLHGVIEAVYAGKPMVLVPFFGDQYNNAAAAEAKGLAKVISNQFSEKMLTDALQEVFSAKMQQNARLVSQMWQDRLADPLETAIYWTERVIRWGHHDPLHSTARDLSFIELASLDVASVLIGALVAVVLALKLFVSLTFKFLRFGKKKEKLH